ncbi:hypothetical protein [Streptomyces cuspidosporus]|uniref:ATP-binding protein n=1 Tax=Streptomyces cuspidosporus TaxID=66882 RepID=A0ABP5TZE8_9ACTN
MKQGTIKTLGAIALGAVAVMAGGGSAAAAGNAPAGPARSMGVGAGQPGHAPRPGQPGPNDKGLLGNLPLQPTALKSGSLPAGLPSGLLG